MDDSEPVVSGAKWWDSMFAFLSTVTTAAGAAYKASVGQTVDLPAVPAGTPAGAAILGGSSLSLTSLVIIGAFGFLLWKMAK